MIQLTRLNGRPLVVNSDLIEHIEVTPDTVIALTTGQKLLVLETADEVIERVVRFRRSLFDGVAVYPFKTANQTVESCLSGSTPANEQ